MRKSESFQAASKDWKVVKRNKNFHNFEIRRFDDPTSKIKVPYFAIDAEIEGYEPAQVFSLFKNQMINQAEWNSHCESVSEYDPQPGVKILRTRLKLPMVSNREFIDRQTCFYDDKEDKYFAFFSEETDPKYDIDSVFPVDKNYVRGSVVMTAYMFSKMENGRGTKFFQVNQVDLKGSLPTYIVNKLAPTGASQFLGCIVNALKA